MKTKLLFITLLTLFSHNNFSQNVVLDATFGSNGIAINQNYRGLSSITQQTNGKIVGYYLSDYNVAGNIHICQFNNDGSVDTTFGVNGKIVSQVYAEVDRISMLKLQADGKILIVGTLQPQNPIPTSGQDFGMARYNLDGSIDITFGNNGYVKTDFANTNEVAYAVETQTDGKILIGGYSIINSSADLLVARYLSNGTLDSTFGVNGKFTMNIGTNTIPTNPSGISDDSVNIIRINQIGDIILGCQTNANESNQYNENFGIVCLNSNGTLKTSFGNNGSVIVDFGDQDNIGDLEITTDNKIIATGQHKYDVGSVSFYNIPIVKLLQDGSFDNSFGTNGKVITNRDSNNPYDAVTDFTIMPDGKLLCTGLSPNLNLTALNIFLIKFNQDGSIDTTFNQNGYSLTDYNNISTISVGLIIQNDGKIICSGGISDGNNAYNSILARYQYSNLSVKDFQTNKLKVYPNPFIDSITIESDNLFSETIIEIYDILGKKINSFSTDNTSIFNINFSSNLSQGNYLLKISNKEKTETFKIIKK